MHLNLATQDVERSVAFYSTLLGAAAVRKRPDYALFVTEQPGLELALETYVVHEESDARDDRDATCCAAKAVVGGAPAGG